MRGIVYRSTGSWYTVRDEKGDFRQTRVKGKLKIDDEISSTNPIAVGDEVVYDREGEEQLIIREVSPRRNYIIRVSPHNRHQKHIIAANLDAALLVATLAEPRTSAGFIDRFLITAEAYHIPAIIVYNKADLMDEKMMQTLESLRRIYEDASYEVYGVSALDKSTIAALEKRLAGNITLFSGHSGVGKSTLINALMPELELRTAEVSAWSGKGQHTTTFAEMFDLPGGGKIIDTPGVKEFGLIDIEREELSQYFPEMRRVMSGCRFNNCMHLAEPGCAVKAALDAGSVSMERYSSYVGILDTIEKKY